MNLRVDLSDFSYFHYDYGYTCGNEEEDIDMIIFQFTENNYACDCNLMSFRDRYFGIPREDYPTDPNDKDNLFNAYPCGSKIKVTKLTRLDTGETLWESRDE